MTSETDSTAKGYHLDEQTFTHIVAAHLDQQTHYETIKQPSANVLLVTCDSAGYSSDTQKQLQEVLDEHYRPWNSTVEQIGDTRVLRVTFDYTFDAGSDTAVARFNSIRERTSGLLALLLDDDPGQIEFTAPSNITFESTTEWPALIDVQQKLTQTRLDQLREAGLAITGVDPQGEFIPSDATRVFVESTGVYQAE